MTPTPEADALAERIVARLTVEGRTVAVAESLTGGAVVAALVGIPGASLAVRGGIVAYDTALKESLLGVPRELLDAHGPVHPAIAAAMAEGVRAAAAVDGHPADLGVATTGVAGPEPHGAAPVGLVYVAVADAAGTTVREHRFAGDRAAIRAHAAHAALILLDELLDAHA
ncbi:CinA family protein [Microcella sp.]|uniref:CinA family protein n=1 Tax=Microcella sp. TaxID=1913979 RepID=UPI003F6F9A0A